MLVRCLCMHSRRMCQFLPTHFVYSSGDTLRAHHLTAGSTNISSHKCVHKKFLPFKSAVRLLSSAQTVVGQNTDSTRKSQIPHRNHTYKHPPHVVQVKQSSKHRYVCMFLLIALSVRCPFRVWRFCSEHGRANHRSVI